MPSFSLKHAALAFAALCLCGHGGEARAQEGTPFDTKSAVLFVYFAIGDDSNPNTSLREEQFFQQMEELDHGGYTIKSLPEIVAAFENGRNLPDRTVALTFDGADRSILTIAAPYLIDKDIPFTVFVPEARVSSGKPSYMNWNDLRSLKRTGLVSFGLHPSGYGHLSGVEPTEIKRQINSSLAAIRKQLDVPVTMIAYPYGEYDDTFKTIVRDMGFKAAFGQQSGVAHAGEDRLALPRFTQTERYGDLERFRMTASALPLPVTDISPTSPFLSSLSPAIGFSMPASLLKDIKSLSCFSSSSEKPEIEILNTSRVEIRMDKPFEEDRPRINCTMPVAGKDGDDTRWRWYGALYTVRPDLLNAAADDDRRGEIELHASDSIDITIE